MSTTGSAPADPALEALRRGFEDVAATVAAGRDGAGTPCIDVPRDRWLPAAEHARLIGFDFLDWLSAVDVPDREPPGVDVVLHLVSTASATTTSGRATDRSLRRMLLRTRVPDADLVLDSLTSQWPGVAWHERETYEMFGVVFAGFDDGTAAGLRPLLLPEGFEGTPLRKSFVLGARASKPWPGAKEPGESDATVGRARRRVQPPGVPDPAGWGPRAAGAPDGRGAEGSADA